MIAIVVIKPEGVRYCLGDEAAIEAKKLGLRVVVRFETQISRESAAVLLRFSKIDPGDSREEMFRFMTCGPIEVLILEGQRALELAHQLRGSHTPPIGLRAWLRTKQDAKFWAEIKELTGGDPNPARYNGIHAAGSVEEFLWDVRWLIPILLERKLLLRVITRTIISRLDWGN